MSDRESSKSASKSASSSPSPPPRKHKKRSKRTPQSRESSKSMSRSLSRSRRRYSRSRSFERRDGKRNRYDYDDGKYSSRRRSPSFSPPPRSRRYMGDRKSLQEHPPESRCLGVFGLNLRTDERQLRSVFEKYGPIDDIQLVYDYHSGMSRGFGFIYYKYVEDAIEARDSASGMDVDGRKIRVDFSITQRAHTPTPGTYLGRGGTRGGGGGGSRYSRRSPVYRSSHRSYSRSRSISRVREV